MWASNIRGSTMRKALLFTLGSWSILLTSPLAVAIDTDVIASGAYLGAATRHGSGTGYDDFYRNGAAGGVNYENREVFVTMDGDFFANGGGDFRAVAAGGVKFLKGGILLLSRSGRGNQVSNSTEERFTATGYGLYARLHPLILKHLTLTVDGYGGRYFTGDNTTTANGVVYSSQDAGDGYGYAGDVSIDVPWTSNFAILARYAVDRIDFDAGIVSGVSTPISVLTHTATLALQWKFR